MRLRSTLILLLLAPLTLTAQRDHQFTTGLAVANCHNYGREAIVTDHLAYLLYTGQLRQPKDGVKLTTDQEGLDFLWKKIEVDSTGRFRGEALSNGYIYLTYQARRAQNALLNISGNSMVYFNGEPHGGDIYNDGWLNIPVSLKKGVNEIMIRCGRFSRWQGVQARLVFPEKAVTIRSDDATLPNIVIGKSNDKLSGAVVIINGSNKSLSGLSLVITINNNTVETTVADIGQRMIRKTGFTFDASGISTEGDHTCMIRLKQDGKIIDEQSIVISAVKEGQHHSYTFTSAIDGSVQYYSVAPQAKPSKEKPALFLSVHGAGVEAIGQARAYQSKEWGVLVAPTNRRPRGFNWEEWGRIDALEVLEHATKKFDPDPEKIYLTGHSMGGHGTWYLGATYPDKWAAIAPCAGYPTLTGYGSADGKIPDDAENEVEKILRRASNPSDVIALAPNFKSHGVYIFHGDADRVVSVNYARQMREVLAGFHPDMSYYEYPGGSHWFGNESVDWPPLFDFFKWHTLKHDSAVDEINFITANPAISSRHRWASVIQQQEPLSYSSIKLVRDRKAGAITGTTGNVMTMKLDLEGFDRGDTVSVTLDSEVLRYIIKDGRELILTRAARWTVADNVDPAHKNARRSGTFKEAFNHRMVFVYGTTGTAKENEWAYNKARYDAEVWYYRGNGAVDIIADHHFDPSKYADRGVILYGNATTNAAWNKLLKDSPIQVTRDAIVMGGNTLRGEDLAAYFTWPRHDSDIASVAVITGTGLPGLRATEANQYFAAGSGFPDYLVFSLEMLQSGAAGIKAAGFFDNEWKLPEDVDLR